MADHATFDDGAVVIRGAGTGIVPAVLDPDAVVVGVRRGTAAGTLAPGSPAHLAVQPMTTSSPQQAAQHPDQLLEVLLASEADPNRTVLFTGATAVTMDPRLGTLHDADVLVRGNRIAEVGHGVHAGGAIVVDVSGCILSPGFVDTHRHAWQAQMRRTIPDVDDLAGYLTSTLVQVAPAYTSHDVSVGTRLAALTALDCGITTMLDVSHNSRSGEHSDAAVTALLDSGIRGVHASMGSHLESIHSTASSPRAWSVMRDAGVTVSLAPTSDTRIGLEDAVPPVDESLAHGIRPGLSIDVEVAPASDMFTQMRTLLSVQRMRAVHAIYGADTEPARISTLDVLDVATPSGARTIGLDRATGSLTPGKQADLIVVDAEDLNTMPLHDPVGTLVLGADRNNIVAVWVAGRARTWDRRLVGVDIAALRAQVHASVDSIAARLAVSSEDGGGDR